MVMGVYFRRSSWLRVTSSLLADIVAGLILLLFTVHNVAELTLDIVFVMVLVLTAVRIEDILEES